jgi:hypothetical protein
MLTRFLVILFIILTGCQTGKIPCPDFKADRVKRSSISKRQWYSDRNTTASAREVQTPEEAKPVKPVINYQRGSEVKPALENINVEEWDCPKPGMKKNLPKALKDNIRKNKKAYESYYKHKVDSVQSARKTAPE